MGWKQTAQGQSNSYQLSGCATDQVLDKNHPITVQFTPPWGNSSQPSSFKLYSTILPDPAPVQVDIKTAPGIITISNNTTAAINTQK
ncbi:MAG: hypothetical protein HWD59_05560 [Coxiellaceae bacterium]|nr:MAG: hypothetical protein HWD59_05560 [Coxiellaceae bacterium]